jgi:hypothetical protein
VIKVTAASARRHDPRDNDEAGAIALMIALGRTRESIFQQPAPLSARAVPAPSIKNLREERAEAQSRKACAALPQSTACHSAACGHIKAPPAATQDWACVVQRGKCGGRGSCIRDLQTRMQASLKCQTPVTRTDVDISLAPQQQQHQANCTNRLVCFVSGDNWAEIICARRERRSAALFPFAVCAFVCLFRRSQAKQQ